MAYNVVNKKDGLVKKVSVSHAQNTGGFDGAIIYVEATKTIYEYNATSSDVINGTSILSTVDGGNSRWIGVAGQYGIYSGGVKPMLIVLTDSDFPSPDRTYHITEAYGQTYFIQLTLDIPTYINFPYNIDVRGNDFSLYYISSTHDIYLRDYEEEWGDNLLDDNTIRTFIATNSTVAGSRWNEKEIYWVGDNAVNTLSKYWFNNEPNSTFKPHVFVGGSEGRQLTVSSVQGLEDYTNMYVFRNSTPYTMTLPTAASNYGRVLRLYRDGDGLITIARSATDTFGSTDLTSLTLNNKQYIELVAANNNQWLITAQSNLSNEQVYLLTSGNYTPTRYVDTIICSNTTESTIYPHAVNMGVGKTYIIKRIGSGNVVIDPNLSQTIDGNLTYTLDNVNDVIVIQSDGSNWKIISEYNDSRNLNLESTTFSNQYGIVSKNNSPFIHDFNYGDNGTVTTIGKNVFIGCDVGNLSMGSGSTSSYQSSNIVGIGNNTLCSNTTGYMNYVIGNDILKLNTIGHSNIAIGYDILNNGTNTNHNIAMGICTMPNVTSASNIGIGSKAMERLTDLYGSYNVAIGRESLSKITGGTENLALGYGAGMYWGNELNPSFTYYLDSATRSIFIGDSSKSKNNNTQNEIVIGAFASGNGQNTATIGNDDTISTHLRGKVISDSSVMVGDNTETPSADNVGSIRYRETATNSYVEVSVKTGVGTYAWIAINTETW